MNISGRVVVFSDEYGPPTGYQCLPRPLRLRIEQLVFGCFFGSVVPGVNLLKQIIDKCYTYWDPSGALQRTVLPGKLVCSVHYMGTVLV